MNNIYVRLSVLIILITILHRFAPNPLKYPKTKLSSNIIDVYHGISIKDEYRWLEDDNSKQTKAWVQKQNAFTDRHDFFLCFKKYKTYKMLTVHHQNMFFYYVFCVFIIFYMVFVFL